MKRLRVLLYLALALVSYAVGILVDSAAGLLLFCGVGVILEALFWCSLFDLFGTGTRARSGS